MPSISIATRRGEITGYLASPTSAGPWPGVVVLHDVFGLRDDTRRFADDFAAAGYLAVAPTLYGGGGPMCIAKVFFQSTRGRGTGYEDVLATRDWLLARPDCSASVGVVGFCLGGAYALVSAPDFHASAPYYGKVPDDWSIFQRSCPVVANYGSKDYLVRSGDRRRLEATLNAQPDRHRFREHPGATHSFANRLPAPWVMSTVFRLRFDAAASEVAWAEVTEFFARHLRGTGASGQSGASP